MAKDPAFLFYSSDFLTGTMIMPFEDRGKYITILCYMHQNGRLNEETIRLLVGSVSDNLRLKFDIDKKGFWFNERLETEIEKRRNFVESRLENGKKGGRPPKKQPLEEKPLGYPTQNLPENENRNEYLDEKEDKEHSEICLKILTDFKFSQQRNPDKLSKISEFVKRLRFDNKFEWFKEQYISYWPYKNLSGQEKQSLETFIDGGWDRQNWTEKLKEQKNGHTNSVDTARASRDALAEELRNGFK
jgi:hypothetical protein